MKIKYASRFWFVAIFCGLAMVDLPAHDNINVHPVLSESAWNILPQLQRDAVISGMGIKETDTLRYSRVIGGIPPAVQGDFTLVNWLRQGAIEEDAPDKRCLGHFYNPLNGQNHSLVLKAGPWNVLNAPDSFQWATDGVSRYVGNNEESWSGTRSYYYDALTKSTLAQRKESAAHTFYALGRIVHLLQDLSQPEHVRNDAHMINGEDTPYTGDLWGIVPTARWIENYGRDNGVGIISKLGLVQPLDWRSAEFKSVENFWNRKKYADGSQQSLDALNADASGGITNKLGLSEFANGNFLGADASYKEVTTGLLNFPHPAITDTNCSGNVSLVQLAGTMKSVTPLTPGQEQAGKPIFLSKTTAGIPVTHHSLLTYTGFKTIQRSGNLGSTTQNRMPLVTINSASVLQEYHEILLKKAVEYSAGLLDYFFRGKLSADCYFDETSGKYHLLVSNVSGQPFHGGSFEVYFDDASGNRTKYTGVTDDYSPQGPTRTLESGYGVEGFWEYFLYGYYSWYEDLGFPCVKIEIPVPNSAAGLAATKAIVVYKDGIIGGKKTDGTAEDSVDEGKAVAAVHFDVPPIFAPQPSIEAMSRGAGKSKSGFPEFTSPSSPPKIYLKSTQVVNFTYSSTGVSKGYDENRASCCNTQISTENDNSGGTQSTTYDAVTGIPTTDPTPANGTRTNRQIGTSAYAACHNPEINIPCYLTPYDNTQRSEVPWNTAYGGTTITTRTSISTSGNDSNSSGGNFPLDPYGCGCPTGSSYVVNGNSTNTTTLSSEYTISTLISNTVAALPAYGSTWYGSASASRDLPNSELSYSIQESRYRFRFNPGAVPAGLGYRLSWVERFLPAITYNASNQVTGGGSALNRIDVVNGGTGYKTATVDSYMDGTGGVEVYVNDGGNGYAVAPTVTLPAPTVGSNGTQATAHAVVSSGAVTEIIMDNAGSGYTAAPVLTLAAPTGSASPVIVISAPGNGGTAATATATLNAAGQIQSISLNAAGSRYTGAPAIYVSSSPNGLGQGATFAVHLGTETEKTATWSGPVSGNYRIFTECCG